MLLWKKDRAFVHLWSSDPWVDRLPFCPLYTARIRSFSICGSVCPEFGHLVPPPGLLEGTGSDPRQTLDVRECHAGKGHLQECRCLRSPKNGVGGGLMWVPADSHPHGVPKCLVEPGGYAKQGTVASYLDIANSPPAPKEVLTPQSVGKGLSVLNCGRPRA